MAGAFAKKFFTLRDAADTAEILMNNGKVKKFAQRDISGAKRFSFHLIGGNKVADVVYSAF